MDCGLLIKATGGVASVIHTLFKAVAFKGAMNSLSFGAPRGQIPSTELWNTAALKNESTTAAIPSEGLMNSPPCMRVWKPEPWSGKALLLTAAS